MDSLYERHNSFLHKCRNQCLLSPIAGVFYKIVRSTMMLISKFSSLFTEFVSTREDTVLTHLLNLGNEFRKSMIHIMNVAYNVQQKLERHDEKVALKDLMTTLDFTGFYSDVN